MNKEKDLAYYLTLFKIDGHQTWRADLKGHRSGFDEMINAINQKSRPKVTEKMIIRIDRLTGGFSEVK